MTEMIALKWALIDGEWVIYQRELDEWVKTSGGPPKCPVCGSTTAGIRRVKKEGSVRRGECAACGARLAIITEGKSP